MPAIESFVELWRAFSFDAATLPLSVGIEDAGALHPLQQGWPELATRELEEREQRVLRLLPEFATSDNAYISQTLPCWLGCLRDESLLQTTRQFHAAAFV